VSCRWSQRRGCGAVLPVRVKPKHSLRVWEMGLTPETSSAEAKRCKRSGVNGRDAWKEIPMGTLSSLKRDCQAARTLPEPGSFEPE
jgi:hypothetical protein